MKRVESMFHDGTHLDRHATRKSGAFTRDFAGVFHAFGIDQEVTAEDLFGLHERTVGNRFAGVSADDAAVFVEGIAAGVFADFAQTFGPGKSGGEHGLHFFGWHIRGIVGFAEKKKILG
jgi:hypothetical protein